jgi:hypothetical protein
MTLAATLLNSVDSRTSGVVNASSVQTLTGAATDVLASYAARTSGTITGLGDEAVTLDGSTSVANANLVDARTTGVITATISNGDMSSLSTLTGVGNAYAITVTDPTVTATSLITLDGKTTVQVNASAVTVLTGTATNVLAATNAAGLLFSGAQNITLTGGTVTVAIANDVATKTTGVVTGIIDPATDLVTLKTLTETNNAYSIVINSDTDASAAAADLNIVDGKTTVAINATAVENLTGTASEVQASYIANAATGITGLGNETVTLADTVLAAATLNSIDSYTTGLVNAEAAATLTGTASDVLAAYVADAANSASGITGLGDEEVTLSGTASATALTRIDSYTTGLVNASAVTTLVGTYAEVQAAFAAAGITGLGSVVVQLTDSLMSASALNDANSKTTGVLDASSVQTLTGAASDVQSAYIADAGAEITGLGNELVTLSDATLAATLLNSIDSYNTGGLVDASSVQTLTGAGADVLAAYQSSGANGITGLGNERVTLSDTTLAVATLNSIDSRTTGLVDAATVATLTGAAADMVTAYESSGANGITGLGDERVELSDTTLAATVLSDVNSKTTGVVDASSVSTLTGAASAVVTAYNANASGEITGLGNERVELSDTTLTVTDLNDINSKTTGVVDASSVQTLTGAASDVQSAYNADATGAMTGLGNERVEFSDTTLAATVLNSIDTFTTGLVDASSLQTLTGAGADVLAAYQSSGANGITGLGNELVTLSDTTLAAATLHSIDSYNTGLVDASTVTTLTGTAAEVISAYASSGANGITGLGDEAVTLSGTTFVTDANTVSGNTSGVVTATITETTLATLTTLSADAQVNAYTITVTDATAAAADLNTVDTRTSVAVIATAISTLTGSAADVLTAYRSAGITGLGDEGVELSDTSLAATALNDVNSVTSGLVNASSVQTLTGAGADVLAA